MKAICADDNKIILSSMLSHIRELLPDAEVIGFESAEEAFAFSKEIGCDILFTEIEFGGNPSGIGLARSIQGLNPRVNIIFTTVCSEKEYAGEIVELRPSAYLTKVVTKQDVEKALQNLLYSV